jgi:dienelactone hydrolase
MAPDAETLSKAEAKTARRRACAFDSMKRKASRMRGRILKPLVTTALLALLTWASAASAEETVTFRSAAGGLDIRGYLAKPEGRGPFPAVVLLHSCLGLPANRQSIEAEVTGWGYVALFVDDFSARGLKETCAVDFPEGASDAYGALAFLAKLAYVDSSRIAVVGFSQGADTALAIAASGPSSAFAIPGDLTFKAAAAFYPPCANHADAEFQLPTLIAVGAQDSVTPAADCRQLAKRQPGVVALVVYPGADHGFDLPEFAGGRRVLGMWLKYDREAAAQSWLELKRFLAKRLR